MANVGSNADGPSPYAPTVGDVVTCPQCLLNDAPDAAFCDQCGQALLSDGSQEYAADPDDVLQCSSCGLFCSGDAIFCDQCGVSIPRVKRNEVDL